MKLLRAMRRFLPTISLLLLLLSPYVLSQREVVEAGNGAVAADDAQCSIIGRNILRRDGNAVDAAVATALCLGVVSPAASGIGGGAFAVLRTANGQVQAIDMREMAPAKAYTNMYHGDKNLKSQGILAVGVPGQLAGLHEMWKQHGSLPWDMLVRPAARLARACRVSPFLYFQKNLSKSHLSDDPGLKQIFTKNNEVLKVGEIFSNPKLGETLDKIAQFGVEEFYNGSIARDLVKDIQSKNGIITLEDFANYRVIFRKPIHIQNVLGHEFITMPPPSSGGVSMIMMLNILSNYKLPEELNGPIGVHRQVEALKHAFAVRNNLGDPDYDPNVANVVSNMTDPRFARAVWRTIRDDSVLPSTEYGSRWNPIRDQGTSHLSIVDKDGNAVAMTCTINAYFGAKILSPSTGIILNNQMDDFTMPMNTGKNQMPPSPSNFVKPGKRPMSSMTPTIVLKDGRLKAIAGASGGANIISGTTSAIVNYLIRGMTPFHSVLAPRVYHNLLPDELRYEDWTTIPGYRIELARDIVEDLRKRGHNPAPTNMHSYVQFIAEEVRKNGRHIVAVSDPRKNGEPAAF